MGNKISIDSATMMNKGLEVIEAHHLFSMPADRIDILIHPQSIVHSMVEYVDGSIIAQLSTTDMKFPIQYALLYPERVVAPFARLDLAKIRNLEFQPVDSRRFPAVALAYDACRAGGSMPGRAQRRERDRGRALPGRRTSVRLDRRNCEPGPGTACRSVCADRQRGRRAALGRLGTQ